jgi:sensor histidine kinase YesM
MNPSFRRYLLPLAHSVIWICLFSYPFLFHYLSISDGWSVSRMALFILLIMGFFYFNTFVLIPKVLAEKKIVLYFLSIVVCIGVISVASGYIQALLNPEYLKKPALFRIGVNTAIISGLLTWFISSSIKVTSEWFKDQQLIQEERNQKLNAELNFLKSQVNPHFLFNALNNIYALQNKNSPQTGVAILKLSDLIRYVLYETSPEYVSLEKEIECIKNYIELQRLGLDTSVSIEFKIEGSLQEKQIHPLLLIPLVENTFKHGISYIGNSVIRIHITIHDGSVELVTENPITGTNKLKSEGIGLDNLRKRLALLYRNSHSLEITNDGKTFITRLKLNLK